MPVAIQNLIAFAMGLLCFFAGGVGSVLLLTGNATGSDSAHVVTAVGLSFLLPALYTKYGPGEPSGPIRRNPFFFGALLATGVLVIAGFIAVSRS